MMESLQLRKIVAPGSGLISLAAGTDRYRTTSRILLCLLSLLVPNYFCLPSRAPAAEAQEAALAEAERLNEEGVALYVAGKYSDAEPLYQRSLLILQKILGPEHPRVATSLNNLAALYRAQGYYGKAEPLYQRSLTIRERVPKPEHRDIAESLNNLGALYYSKGQYAKAEQFFQRSNAILEIVLGADDPKFASSLNNLASLYNSTGQYAKAEQLFQRSLAIREKAAGPLDVATSLNNLAELYRNQGQYAKAEQLFKRSKEIREKGLGAEHPDVAASLNNLAELYRTQRQYAEAEPLFQRSLMIWEKILGPEHPDVAMSLNNLAFLYEKQDQFVSARSFYERGRQARLASIRSNADIDDEAQTGLLTLAHGGLLRYAGLLSTISRSPMLDDKPGSAQRDAFMVLEQARSGLAQSALAKSSSRAAAETPASRALARAVQDLRYRRQALSKRLDAEYGEIIAQRNNELVDDLRKERQKLDYELKAAVEKLNKTFPKYAELAAPDPITIEEVEKLLRTDEAMLSFFTHDDRLLVWLVRKNKAYLYRDITIKKQELHKLVTQVRVSLDQSNGDFPNSLTPFDVRTSFDLYKLLFLPFKEELEGVNNLIIVPDEVLLPIPFGALITNNKGDSFKTLSELSSRIDTDDWKLLEYTKLPWLIKDYALTILPSATSLRALRQIPRTKQKETELLIAFGDPALGGGGVTRGGAMLPSRGTFVPVEEIRKLDRLPGTKVELESIAKALGAKPDNSLYLGENATEPTVTKLNTSGRLARAEVVAFATHGLISGDIDIKGLKEPALVLTPPETPTEEDDGLLGLQDVLKLKLDSTDWVTLSACNTGSADGSGQGLSGLTRAFFFAGARSLLVSHWYVDDEATQNLMSEIFQRYARNKNIPKAEALRQGMLALLEKAQSRGAVDPSAPNSTAYFAHPFAWAPFFLVGER
jgi:CHAT domain-containing protein/Tfp pilus assembly protein PilF